MKKMTVFRWISYSAAAAAIVWVAQDTVYAGKQNTGSSQTATSSGAVPIGGAFELTDQQGKTVRDGDFRGRAMLVFFGFTHCPDICPTTVSTLSKTMEILGDKADQVAPIFITVDPKRDTPRAMKDYLAHFDPRLVGLTGTQEQVKRAANAYKVYFSQAKTGDDYMVDHSSIVYLMDKNGQYVRHFSYDEPAQAFADGVAAYLESGK